MNISEIKKTTLSDDKKFLVPDMANILIINEKPSVSREFSKALGIKETEKHDGYIEGYSSFFGCNICITWCIGHLITMSYPEKYDEKYKKWSIDEPPFLPSEYKYEVISSVRKQFDIVKKIFHTIGTSDEDKKELSTLSDEKNFLVPRTKIYYAGDSGREGAYIQALVRQEAGHKAGVEELMVWIDSQTEDEIRRGIREAKPWTDYQNMIDSGYERAIEDYAIGLNFTRAMSVLYGNLANLAADTKKYRPISVGRVMSCVLGMIVRREREILEFKTTPFYKIGSNFSFHNIPLTGEWKVTSDSTAFESPLLYNETGFLNEADAKAFMDQLPEKLTIVKAEKKTEKKNAPFLFNLAELQSECTKKFKISPSQTLEVAQSLYEKKLTTYPRTDARVLSTAVAKEIGKNIEGLKEYSPTTNYCETIMENGWYKGIENTKYTDDKKVTDHYALVPTGSGFGSYGSLSQLEKDVYDLIVRRFLSIFYPAAEYFKVKIDMASDTEHFYTTGTVLNKPGYLEVAGKTKEDNGRTDEVMALASLKEGEVYNTTYNIKKGETKPPTRYTSGSMVLAMESAGQLIEDEELRAQIKSTGIGTSATRGETIQKLVRLEYINQNNKTQILTPSSLGNIVYEILDMTIPAIMNPKMTASWEKGLEGVVNGTVSAAGFRGKLESYVRSEIEKLKEKDLTPELQKKMLIYAKDKHFMEKKSEEGQELPIPCPICGGKLTMIRNGCVCENYKSKKEIEEGSESGCSFFLGSVSGVVLNKSQIEKLLKGEELPVIKGFTSKDKKKFDAGLKMELVKDENDSVVGKKMKFIFPEQETITLSSVCPICGGAVHNTRFGYACENFKKDADMENGECNFYIGQIAGKQLLPKEMENLIRTGELPLTKGFKSKTGKKFDAGLKLEVVKEDGIKKSKVSFVFPERKVEDSNMECPKCNKPMKKTDYNYFCDCGYKISHTVASKKLTDEQVMQLMQDGKTSLIKGFRSKKGKKFDAILTCDPDGKIEFQFADKNEK